MGTDSVLFTKPQVSIQNPLINPNHELCKKNNLEGKWVLMTCLPRTSKRPCADLCYEGPWRM